MLTPTRAAIAAMAIFGAAPAFALFPQQGMWTIGSELNGKPGRGVQIDRQGGRVLILTYFGYRADGSATFMQASGAMTDGKSFSGDLTEFKNGPALGGPTRSGEVAQVAGPVRVEFDTSTSGTITLPGEAPQRFARFQYEDHKVRIRRSFAGQVLVNPYMSGMARVRLYIQVQGDRLLIQESKVDASGNSTSCNLDGDLRATGDTFASTGTATCSNGGDWAGSGTAYRITDLKVDEYGVFSARLNHGSAPTRYYTGHCQTTGPVFLTPSICSPSEFGFSDDDLRE